MADIKPVLVYPGSKWLLADWIVGFMPPHTSYLEPYCGSAAVLLSKPSDGVVETINDIDHRLVTFFRVLRDRPSDLIRAVELTPNSRHEFDEARDAYYADDPADDLEVARRYLAVSWLGRHALAEPKAGWRFRIVNRKQVDWLAVPDRLAAVAERLRSVQIECRPALEVIQRFADPEVLIYADPPYVTDVRREHLYANELDNADHLALLTTLRAHPGPVLLSGYANDLYDDTLTGWSRIDRHQRNSRANLRTESLWLNPAAQRGGQQRLF